MNCLSCTADTTNGLALCELCQMKASKCLEFLPVYFHNLARWRPGRAGSRPVPGSREPSGVGYAVDDRVSRALDEVGADLTGWAQALADDRLDGVIPASNDETSSVRVACWFLASNLTSVATLDWCGEMVDRRQVGPGEYRATSVRGGTTHSLSRGDVLAIPNGVPHWFKDISGPFLYYVVKVIQSH